MTEPTTPSPTASRPGEEHVRTVHVVAKTHLDIGFTDLAAAVTERYHEEFLPRALATADELRAAGGPERLVWTTGAWLVLEHLERLEARGEAGAAALTRVEQAIREGDLAWHALPCTTHTELLDPSLARYALSLSARLDRRFGRRTVAAKLTDVPGHTRGLVPLLAEAAVELLHIGVNPASCPPSVPPAFRWCDPSGAEVVVVYQAGAYGAVTVLPGVDEALAFVHTGDNDGPPTAQDVRHAHAALRRRFPTAEIRASTLDAFARAVRPGRGQLPVVTGELGDTWIHGAASDPVKLARYRELVRLRAGWLRAGALDPDPTEPVHDRFSRPLLLVAEHTWGLDEKLAFPDVETYEAGAFATLRQGPAAARFEASWAEQRAYLDQAVAALGDRPVLEREALVALADLHPVPADRSGWRPLPPAGDGGGAALVTTARFEVGVDPATGALSRLIERAGGRVLADHAHLLGRFRYRTFDGDDYARFRSAYNVNGPEDEHWARHDFAKPGIDAAGAVSAWWEPAGTEVSHRRDDTAGTDEVLVVLRLPTEAVERFGAPAEVTARWTFPDDRPVARLDLQWSGKRPCRFPEASWLCFTPALVDPSGWRLDKLGEWIDPADVVPGGGRRLHGVGAGARYAGPDGALELVTLDAALVAPGAPDLLRFDNEPLDLAGGMHLCLHDNVWGTNFPMWFGEDARFRVALDLTV